MNIFLLNYDGLSTGCAEPSCEEAQRFYIWEEPIK